MRDACHVHVPCLQACRTPCDDEQAHHEATHRQTSPCTALRSCPDMFFSTSIYSVVLAVPDSVPNEYACRVPARGLRVHCPDDCPHSAFIVLLLTRWDPKDSNTSQWWRHSVNYLQLLSDNA